MAKATTTTPKTTAKKTNATPSTPEKYMPPKHVMDSLRSHQEWWASLSPRDKLDAHLSRLADKLHRFCKQTDGRWPEAVAGPLREAEAAMKLALDGIRTLPEDFRPSERTAPTSGGTAIKVGATVALKEKYRASFADVFDTFEWRVKAIRAGQIEVETNRGPAFFPASRLDVIKPAED